MSTSGSSVLATQRKRSSRGGYALIILMLSLQFDNIHAVH